LRADFGAGCLPFGVMAGGSGRGGLGRERAARAMALKSSLAMEAPHSGLLQTSPTAFAPISSPIWGGPFAAAPALALRSAHSTAPARRCPSKRASDHLTAPPLALARASPAEASRKLLHDCLLVYCFHTSASNTRH